MIKKSFIISGPTASGKSDFAHEIALRLGGTIINADSVQIYRGIETLSASPKPADNYRLYSIIDPDEKMSAGLYAELAAKEYDLATTPIFVGGTGFYLKALTSGFSKLPTISNETRTAARAVLNKYQELKKYDPAMADKLHPNDAQRISRALEVFMETGKPMSEWQNAPLQPALPYTPTKIAIIPPREELLERAAQRREQMLAGGAIEEVRRLINFDIQANGFMEIKKWINGEISKEEMLKLWEISDAQYIKRQMTWLRHKFGADITIDHIPASKDIDHVCGL
ncbi:MAG: tRNA (adenosine(37)-N6)-dimethylallyltransferase MiaA [Alphaproteobacteria bacterium]|nr:tRNA (adenosine(37)-N6)-dimethylallyltransferase MiaA [Alphaproteobacteria bacterium]